MLTKRFFVGLAALALGFALHAPAQYFVSQPPTSDDGKKVTVRNQDRVVMVYRHGDTIKPYVEQLLTPGGINILRDSPLDHKHHHGLMFAVAVDGVSFWEEREPFGREGSRNTTLSLARGLVTKNEIRRGIPLGWSVFGGCSEEVDWIGSANPKALLQETRTIEPGNFDGTKATVLTWQSRLSLPAGKASAAITGAEYFGLGMRFVQSMDKDGRFINADGKTGVANTNAKRSKWCAYSAQVDGKPVTVAMFDDPGNYRYPTTWFTMEQPFAYLCATLDLKNQPITLTPDKPLVLRYGVALWDGTVAAAQIDRLYQQWTSASAPPLQH